MARTSRRGDIQHTLESSWRRMLGVLIATAIGLAPVVSAQAQSGGDLSSGDGEIKVSSATRESIRELIELKKQLGELLENSKGLNARWRGYESEDREYKPNEISRCNTCQLESADRMEPPAACSALLLHTSAGKLLGTNTSALPTVSTGQGANTKITSASNSNWKRIPDARSMSEASCFKVHAFWKDNDGFFSAETDVLKRVSWKGLDTQCRKELKRCAPIRAEFELRDNELGIAKLQAQIKSKSAEIRKECDRCADNDFLDEIENTRRGRGIAGFFAGGAVGGAAVFGGGAGYATLAQPRTGAAGVLDAMFPYFATGAGALAFGAAQRGYNGNYQGYLQQGLAMGVPGMAPGFVSPFGVGVGIGGSAFLNPYGILGNGAGNSSLALQLALSGQMQGMLNPYALSNPLIGMSNPMIGGSIFANPYATGLMTNPLAMSPWLFNPGANGMFGPWSGAGGTNPYLALQLQQLQQQQAQQQLWAQMQAQQQMMWAQAQWQQQAQLQQQVQAQVAMQQQIAWQQQAYRQQTMAVAMQQMQAAQMAAQQVQAQYQYSLMGAQWQYQQAMQQYQATLLSLQGMGGGWGGVGFGGLGLGGVGLGGGFGLGGFGLGGFSGLNNFGWGGAGLGGGLGLGVGLGVNVGLGVGLGGWGGGFGGAGLGGWGGGWGGAGFSGYTPLR